MLNRIDPPSHMYIAQSSIEGAGRGVFAKQKIMAGTLIEQCPVIALSDAKDRARLRSTGLVSYYFLWGEGRLRAALCLGWGSIYNHSFSPNARYVKMMEETQMDFYALRDIEADEEITVNYNGAPDDRRRLTVPGIPAEAGGPLPSTKPKIIEGLLRRARLLCMWVKGR